MIWASTGEWQEQIVSNTSKPPARRRVGTRRTDKRPLSRRATPRHSLRITEHNPPRKTSFPGGPTAPSARSETVHVEPLEGGARPRKLNTSSSTSKAKVSACSFAPTRARQRSQGHSEESHRASKEIPRARNASFHQNPPKKRTPRPPVASARRSLRPAGPRPPSPNAVPQAGGKAWRLTAPGPVAALSNGVVLPRKRRRVPFCGTVFDGALLNAEPSTALSRNPCGELEQMP